VTVFDDPNSTYVGLQQPPVTFPVNDTDFKTVANGFSSVTLVTAYPPAADPSFDFFRFDTTIQIPVYRFPTLDSLALTPVVTPAGPSAAAEWGSSVVVPIDSVLLHDGRLLHEAVDADGNTILEEPLPDGSLQDLPKLFRQLPDGRHRILRVEPGASRPRVLLDVYLRDGKPTAGGTDNHGAPRAGATSKAALPETPPRSAEQNNSASAEASPADSNASLSAAALGGAAWLALPHCDWEQTLDRALAGTGACRMSKPARIARRLRRRLAARSRDCMTPESLTRRVRVGGTVKVGGNSCDAGGGLPFC
jgi:hypothetical protein